MGGFQYDGDSAYIKGGTDDTSIGNTTDRLKVVIPDTVAVTQSTSPWVVSGTVAATQSGSWSVTVSGTVAVTQSTSPWVVSGTVAATQSGTWTVQQGSAPWSVSQSGTWTTGRTWTLASGTDSVAAVQSGTWTTARSWTLSSGTDSIAAVQSGTWTMQPGNTANTTPWLVTDSSDGTVSPGTAAAKSSLGGMVYNTSAPTPTNGQQLALQSDASGNLKVNPGTVTITGTVAATQSGTWSTGRTWTLSSGTDSVSTARSWTLSSGTDSVAVTQSTSPWVVTGSGTAGSAAAGVVTIQGIASMTAVKVDGSAVTQPISAASLPLPTGAATSALQTTGNTTLSTISGQLPATLGAKTTANSLAVNIASDQTVPVSAASLPLPTGAATSANQSTEITSLQLIDDLPHADDASLGKGVPMMGQLDDVSTNTVTENHVAPVRITAKKALHVNLRDVSGSESGTSGNPVRVDPTGTTTQPVNVSSITLSAGQVPTFSNKLAVDITTTPVNITSSSTYNTIYTYSGTGLLVGFSSEFNNVSIVVKLTIDSNIVFDGFDISTLNGFLFTANTVDRRQNGQGITSLSAALDFSMRQPIRFTSSVVISARLTSGAVTRTFNQGVVYIQKDT